MADSRKVEREEFDQFISGKGFEQNLVTICEPFISEFYEKGLEGKEEGLRAWARHPYNPKDPWEFFICE